ADAGAATTAPAAGGATAAELDCTKIQSDIKVGMEGSLTGGTADYGQGMVKGFQLAIQEYNAGGGYQGTPVGCAIYDDATKAETGQENVARLINQDKVVGIIGAANSGVVLGFSPQIQETGIPLIVPVATGTKITQQFPPPNYIFRVSMADIDQTDSVLAFAQSKGWTKLALFASSSGYGQGGQTDVTAEAPKYGVELVSIQNFEETDTDMTAQVQAARDAGAQAVFTYALAPALSNIFKSMDKVGFKVPVVGSWALSQPTLRNLAGEDLLKGYEIYMAQSYTIDQNDVAKALHQTTLEQFGEDPFPIAVGQTYDATRLLLLGLAKAGPDPKLIRDAIEQISDFKAATTAPAQPFTDIDHEAINAADIFIGQLEEVDGALQVVKAQ
ncbi:MAG: ABC transporter substrate-binding protein, partial [Chloroflexales bacterium]|nr:ABC transporter substrate-binding protein [Chloroflexales bacterium]